MYHSYKSKFLFLSINIAYLKVIQIYELKINSFKKIFMHLLSKIVKFVIFKIGYFR